MSSGFKCLAYNLSNLNLFSSNSHSNSIENVVYLKMESQLKNVKRQRSENWLEEDKMILKELIRERVSIIENKNTDANTNAKKVAAWNNLRISFNSMAHTPRTLQQIKAQWGIIKMNEKKKKCLERKQRFQTGGGPPPATDPPTGDDIAVWLPHEFTVDSNEFDSDNQLITDNKKEEPEPSILVLQSPLLCENPESEIEMISQPGTSKQIEQNTPTSNLLASTSKEPDTLQITTTPTKKKLKTPIYKLKNKQINKGSASAALQIAENEIACRKELHEVQMAVEQQKLKNLLLKEQVLKSKLEYYKNKLN